MISGFAFILFRGEWPWDGRSQLADSALYLLTRSGLRSCSARSQHVADPTRARQNGHSGTLWLFTENVTSTGNLRLRHLSSIARLASIAPATRRTSARPR